MAPAGYGSSVEGIHAVRAAAEADRVMSAVVERGRAGRGDLQHLISELRRRDVRLEMVDDVRRAAETSAPQGIVASCRPIQPVGLEEMVSMSVPASLLLVDRVEDPQNLGAIIRSAVAAGIPRVVISERRAAPLSAAAFKAAAGTLERCAVAIVTSVADAVSRLAELGVWTVGLDAEGQRELFGLDLLSEPVALVIGSETGLSRLVRDRVDLVVSIPMSRHVESLNASVAAALACFEVSRVRAG